MRILTEISFSSDLTQSSRLGQGVEVRTLNYLDFGPGGSFAFAWPELVEPIFSF